MKSINEFEIDLSVKLIYLNDYGMKFIYELESIFELFK